MVKPLMTPAGELVDVAFGRVPAEPLNTDNLQAWESYLALGLTDDALDAASLWTCQVAEDLDERVLEHFQEEEVELAAFSLLTLADAIICAVAAGIDQQMMGDGDVRSQEA